MFLIWLAFSDVFACVFVRSFAVRLLCFGVGVGMCVCFLFLACVMCFVGVSSPPVCLPLGCERELARDLAREPARDLERELEREVWGELDLGREKVRTCS